MILTGNRDAEFMQWHIAMSSERGGQASRSRRSSCRRRDFSVEDWSGTVPVAELEVRVVNNERASFGRAKRVIGTQGPGRGRVPFRASEACGRRWSVAATVRRMGGTLQRQMR